MAAVGDGLEWGKRMLRAHTNILVRSLVVMEDSMMNRRIFTVRTNSETMSIVQTQRRFLRESDVLRHGRTQF
jgi:hypothetical protein